MGDTPKMAMSRGKHDAVAVSLGDTLFWDKPRSTCTISISILSNSLIPYPFSYFSRLFSPEKNQADPHQATGRFLRIETTLDHKVATSRQRSGSIGSPTADSKGSLLRARTIKALAVIEPILHGLGKTEIDLRKILEIGYIYIYMMYDHPPIWICIYIYT